MVHALNRTVVDYRTIAVAMITIEYHGRASHASVEPEKGLNALDATIGLFHGVNALRQQVPQDVRMHGIIARGDTAPNVIPDYTRCEWLLRAETLEKLEWLTGRFRDCAEGAGRKAGCQTEFTLHCQYKPRVPNQTMLKLFGGDLLAIDVAIDPPPETGGRGSSDMGDVSMNPGKKLPAS